MDLTMSPKVLLPIPPDAAPLVVSHPQSASPGVSEPPHRRSNSVTSDIELATLDLVGAYPASSHYSDSVPELLEVPPSRTPSPTTSAASEHSGLVASPSPVLCDTATRKEILFLLVKCTSAWVLGGIGLMIAGIGIVQGVILPRIFTCPSGADCPISVDPNTTNVLQQLQTLMQYLLQGGMLVTGIGLMQLSAYQAWFLMMRPGGNTMANLDLNLGAIRGSLLDATRLVFRKGNRWLSAIVLSQLVIGAAITLIIGFSIIRETGTRLLTFTYPGNTQFPNSDLGHLNSVGQLKAIAKVNAWALGNDTTHSHAYRGTLVTPDVRKIAINSKAAGSLIKGTLSCIGFSNYTIVTKKGKATQYDMHLEGQNYIATPGMRLAVSLTSTSRAAEANYIWASNTKGRLLNATETSDGVMYMALCTHKIKLAKIGKAKPGVQELTPTTPQTSGCIDDSPDVCVSDAVNKAIISWWGGLGTSMWGVNCRGSVLGPLPPSGVAKENNCTLTEKLWSETALSMLDAIVQTGPRSMSTTQKLIVPVETINTRRWWLQALVPFLALVLYGVGLFYTVVLSQGRNVLKKLNLAEIIGASQTDHVRTLVDSGNLKTARMQYGSETGFIIPNHRVGSTDDGRA